MKLKIYVKYFDPVCGISFIQKGDWIDLRASADVSGKKGQLQLIPLGVAMRLPKGFEAIVNPRSSTPLKHGFTMPNSQGVIDNSYQGDTDYWMCPALFFKDGVINKGDRICQFRIQLSQRASVWDKLKWLFCSGIEFVEVEYLTAKNRGGFGSTGRAEVVTV